MSAPSSWIIYSSSYVSPFASSDFAKRFIEERPFLASQKVRQTGQIYPFAKLHDEQQLNFLLPDDEALKNIPPRLHQALMYMLSQVDSELKKVPQSIPLYIHLCVDIDDDISALSNHWQTLQQYYGLPSVHYKLNILPKADLSILQHWEKKYSEALHLLLAIQLYDIPFPNSSEAVTSLLLVPSALVEPDALKQIPSFLISHQIHWNNFDEELNQSLQQNNLTPDEIEFIWESGEKIDALATVAMIKNGMNTKLMPISTSTGHAGIATDWLTLAIAYEYAKQTTKPQAVFINRSDFVGVAIIQTV